MMTLIMFLAPIVLPILLWLLKAVLTRMAENANRRREERKRRNTPDAPQPLGPDDDVNERHRRRRFDIFRRRDAGNTERLDE